MLRNLRNALKNKNITLKAYADFFSITEKFLWNKINEVSDFSYPEAKEIIKQIRYHLDEAGRHMFKLKSSMVTTAKEQPLNDGCEEDRKVN